MTKRLFAVPLSAALLALTACGVEYEESAINDDATVASASDNVNAEGDLLGGIELLQLPSGSFLMGSPEDDAAREHDEQQHSVVLTGDFEVSLTKVTNGQFIEYMGYDPVEMFVGCTDCPVQNVSWHEAAAYANAMSDVHGLEQCFTCEGDGLDVECQTAVSPYECSGYRLPTEAEWEYAARGGEDFEYPGSDDVSEVGWWYENADHVMQPVAQLAPNAFGLYDMAGDVREFVMDWYAEYPDGEVTDPWVSQAEGAHPVERGGSFECVPQHLRPETRYMHMNAEAPHDYNQGVGDMGWTRDVHVGFRLARTVK